MLGNYELDKKVNSHFTSASATSIGNDDVSAIGDYTNFIQQQKQLMQKIHSQEKKLKNYHSKQANPNLMSVSSTFVKRYNSFNSKHDKLDKNGFDRLKHSMQTVSQLCTPMPLVSTALPAPSKTLFKTTASDNNLNRQKLNIFIYIYKFFLFLN